MTRRRKATAYATEAPSLPATEMNILSAPDRFFGRFDHGIDPVPFIFGVVKVEFLGAVRAVHGDLGWR